MFEDEERKAIALYGRDHNEITAQGPFALKQGGSGIAIRNPIFLKAADGQEQFWGFVIVIIKVPELYETTLSDLKDFGYEYCLDTTISPVSTKSVRVTATVSDDASLNHPESVSIVTGACTWTLNVEPTSGWTDTRFPMVIAGTIVIASLLLLMTFLSMLFYAQRKRMSVMARTDALTGLLGRRGFMEMTEEIMKKNPKKPMTAVFIDLDDFKQINDRYGHNIGDEALINLAKNLRTSFPENATIGRTGGDEFCVLLSGMTPERCQMYVEAATQKDQSFKIGEKEYDYTISAGFADYPTQAATRARLMTIADEALYAAKINGKNQCLHYESYMSDNKRNYLGFNVKSLASGIPGAFLVYEADGDEQILFANEFIIELLGCSDFNDFMTFTDASFKSIVHPDDYERVERKIREQINAARVKDDVLSEVKLDDVVDYRIITKNGDVKMVHEVGRLIHSEQHGNVFYVFIREIM